jgi:hypothetical protein
MTGKVSCCILIPLYKQDLTADESLSLANTIIRCPDRVIFILHPPHCQQLVDRLIAWLDHPQLQSQCLPASCFNGIASYNRMLLLSDFYASFAAYEWILIVQLDALLFSADLDFFMNQPYDYWGAPFFLGIDQPLRPLRLLGGGNGGLSLRRVKPCMRILERPHWLYPAIRQFEHVSLPGQFWRAFGRALRQIFSFGGGGLVPSMFEDLFWSFIAPKIDPKFQVAPPEKAMYFAFETEPSYLRSLIGALPLGCHAWRRHSPYFWEQEFRYNDSLMFNASKLSQALMSFLSAVD